MDALELAARHLAGWSGSGQHWHADFMQQAADEAERDSQHAGPQHYALSVCWRGRVEEQAGSKTKQRVRRLHRWSIARRTVAIPFHRPCHDASGALAFAKLPGPLAPILLLYASEDLRQWPTVERFALACLPCIRSEAIGDAMRRILWGSRGQYSPPPQDARARSLGVRAATYRAQTRKAESLLRRWLDRAAWGFLLALNDGEAEGTAGHPESDLNMEGARIAPQPTTQGRDQWTTRSAPLRAM
jgi:hypothetical protein